MGKVKQFLQDLYSGKLHREFHYGPDDPEEEEEKEEEGGDAADSGTDGDDGTVEHIPRLDDDKKEKIPVQRSTDPPESTFVHLGPSKNRYTFKDEF